MSKTPVLSLALVLLLAGPIPSLAQVPTDSDRAQSSEMKQQAQGKLHNKRACREQAKSSGMRGVDLRNRVKVCQAEGRLTCEKKAAEARANGSARRELIDKCLSEL
jgi:hypothetical protein